MWSRLMELFRSMPTEDVQSPTAEPIESEIQIETPSTNFEGHSQLMGYDYLKRPEDEQIQQPKKFINLTKLLRGDYK